MQSFKAAKQIDPKEQMHKKPLWRTGLKVLAAAVLSLSAGLAFFAVHLYRHPETLKTLLEKHLAAEFGGRIRIAELDYGIHPLFVRARRITLAPGGRVQGLTVNIDALAADLSLSGGFGRRVLQIDRLAVNGFSLQMLPGPHLSPGDTTAPGPLQQAAAGLARYLLFRSVVWGSVNVTDSRLGYTAGDARWEYADVSLHVDSRRHSRIVGNLTYRKPDGSWRAALKGLTLSTETPLDFGKRPQEGVLRVQDGYMEGPALRLNGLRGSIQLTLATSGGRLSFAAGPLHSAEVQWTPPDTAPLVLTGAALSAAGVYDVDQGFWDLSEWRLRLADAADLAGSAASTAGSLNIRLLEGKVRLDPVLQALAAGRLPEGWSGRLAGDAALQGRITRKTADGFWVVDAAVRLNENRWTAQKKENLFSGSVSGRLELQGRAEQPKLSLDLEGFLDPFEAGPAAVGATRIHLTSSGVYPDFAIPEWVVRIASASVPVGPGRLDMSNVTFDLTDGRVNAASGTIQAPEITISSDSVKNLRGSFLRRNRSTQLQMAGRKTGLLELARSLALLPPGWRFSAEDELHLSADSSGGGIRFSAAVGFENGSVQSPDERLIAETLQLRGRFDGRLPAAPSQAALQITVAADHGEVLWDKLYVDLNAHPLTLNGRAVIGQPLIFESVELACGGLLDLEASGSYRFSNGLKADIVLSPSQLAPLFRFFLLEPLRFENPWLADLELDGSLGARLTLDLSRPTPRCRGRLYWREGRFKWPRVGIDLGGVDLDLPIWYDPTVNGRNTDLLEGHLRVARSTLPLVTESAIAIALEAEPNRMTLQPPPVLAAGSGRLLLQPIHIDRLFSPRPVARTALGVEAVPWQTVLPAAAAVLRDAVLQGRLESVKLNPQRLVSRGEITSEIFGGRITAADIGIDGLFSAAPVVSADISLERLNLEQITRNTAFGKIEGRISGTIHDLELVGAQPQAFDLRLETVPDEDLRQKISVRAVENISRIGGGASPFGGLAGVFASTLREFRYHRIGIAAGLNNDMFRINGTIHENALEYLIKGATFMGVNVINRNPDNRISFDDMVRRIERIGFGQNSDAEH